MARLLLWRGRTITWKLERRAAAGASGPARQGLQLGLVCLCLKHGVCIDVLLVIDCVTDTKDCISATVTVSDLKLCASFAIEMTHL